MARCCPSHRVAFSPGSISHWGSWMRYILQWLHGKKIHHVCVCFFFVCVCVRGTSEEVKLLCKGDVAYNQGPRPTKLPDCVEYRARSAPRTCSILFPGHSHWPSLEPACRFPCYFGSWTIYTISQPVLPSSLAFGATAEVAAWEWTSLRVPVIWTLNYVGTCMICFDFPLIHPGDGLVIESYALMGSWITSLGSHVSRHSSLVVVSMDSILNGSLKWSISC